MPCGVLEGTQEDDRLFALIHSIDPDDDPWEEASWANPSGGQAVQPGAIGVRSSAVGADVAAAAGRGWYLFRATIQNFSPAIVELDAAMRAGRLRHDGNPVLTWCIGNVVGKADRRGNLYPTKSRPDQKIDAAVALMMALSNSSTTAVKTGYSKLRLGRIQHGADVVVGGDPGQLEQVSQFDRP